MTLEEFSNGFDTLLNSYSKGTMFGEDSSKADVRLDEYEKSLFLTKAQEDVVLSLYTGRNIANLSFEETEELRRNLSSLVFDAELEPISTTNGKPLGLDSKSKFFSLPDGSEENIPAVWFIIYESVKVSQGKCGNETTMDVVPVRHDEYNRLKKNPFRGANDRRALRLDLFKFTPGTTDPETASTQENVVEIICKYEVTKYYLRYLRKLNPIVLIDFGDENSINGVSEATPCEVDSSLHQRILDRAVELAIKRLGIIRNSD